MTETRVIMTSSESAVNGYADSNKIYTEQDWNEYSSLTKFPYGYSKVEAEKAAWKWMDDNANNISFDLITLCPSFVIGKNFNGKVNESNGVLPRIVNGFFPVFSLTILLQFCFKVSIKFCCCFLLSIENVLHIVIISSSISKIKVSS